MQARGTVTSRIELGPTFVNPENEDIIDAYGSRKMLNQVMQNSVRYKHFFKIKKTAHNGRNLVNYSSNEHADMRVKMLAWWSQTLGTHVNTG